MRYEISGDTLDQALATAAAAGASALYVMPDDPLMINLPREDRRARRCYRLPASTRRASSSMSAASRATVPNLPASYRTAASYMLRVKDGAAPAALPVEQPTRFEMVVSERTAKALGLGSPRRSARAPTSCRSDGGFLYRYAAPTARRNDDGTIPDPAPRRRRRRGARPVRLPPYAIDQLKVMIPAGPGGGFDQTGRNLGAAMQAAGSVKSIQYDNKGGAGGAIGLAQFITTSKGDPDALFVTGMVTVGATHLNKSPVTSRHVTPIARLTAEAEAIIVPASSPIKNAKDLVAAMKANPGAVSFSGGSAGGTDHILAGLIAKDVGVDPGEGQLRAVHERRRSGRGGAGRPGDRRHLRLRRVRAAHQGRARARDRRVVGRARRRHRHPDAEGAGRQRRARQLARRVRRAGHHRRPAARRCIAAVEAGIANAKWKETLAKLDWTSYVLTGDAFRAFVEADSKRVGAILDSLNLGAKK